MNTYVAKNILRLITYFRGEPLWQSLKFLENSQWWKYEKIQEYQQIKLTKLLRYCSENVPFYRQWFKDNACAPQDIKLHNIDLLPTMDKFSLRENLSQFIAIDYKEPIEKAKTSGSTGISLHFPKSLKSSAFQLAAMYRGHKWHGIEPGAKEARLWGIPVNKISRFKTTLTDFFLLNRFREREYNLNEDILNNFCIRLERRKPVYLMGYTSMVRQFAKFLLETGRNGLKYNLKMVKCTSETIHESDRKIIESAFGCPLVSEYGVAETGLIAFQCDAGSQHLMEDCCIVEFLEPNEDPGDPNLKEIVVTNLDNYVLPFIRYRTDDLAVPSSDMCRCGRELPLIQKIVGRISDVIRASDGRRWHSIILYYIMKGLAEKHGGIIQFKVFQRKLDSLEFLLIPDRTFSHETEQYLRNQCIKHFGEKMKVDFKIVDIIPRERSGKLRDFISTI